MLLNVFRNKNKCRFLQQLSLLVTKHTRKCTRILTRRDARSISPRLLAGESLAIFVQKRGKCAGKWQVFGFTSSTQGSYHRRLFYIFNAAPIVCVQAEFCLVVIPVCCFALLHTDYLLMLRFPLSLSLSLANHAPSFLSAGADQDTVRPYVIERDVLFLERLTVKTYIIKGQYQAGRLTNLFNPFSKAAWRLLVLMNWERAK